MQRALAAFLAIGFAVAAAPAAASLEDAVKALQQDGRILLIRHAQTEPGTGDPANFTIGDCATQRNLDHRGRADAQRLGAALRDVRFGKALSSAWCRCTETAALMLASAGQANVEVETFEPLNSFYEDRAPRERRVREATAAAAAWQGPGALLMSTHMVNILGMTGRSLRSGGFLVLEPEGESFRIVAEGAP